MFKAIGIFVAAGAMTGACVAPTNGTPASPSSNAPANSAPPSSAPSTAVVSPGSAEPPHVRAIGPADQAREVVVRFGDVLDVTPPNRAGGWQAADIPTNILRLRGSGGPAPKITFVAVAVGEGQLRLVPANGAAGNAFTVRVRVLRDTVLTPPA
jgi:hypothetical protein